MLGLRFSDGCPRLKTIAVDAAIVIDAVIDDARDGDGDVIDDGDLDAAVPVVVSTGKRGILAVG